MIVIIYNTYIYILHIYVWYLFPSNNVQYIAWQWKNCRKKREKKIKIKYLGNYNHKQKIKPIFSVIFSQFWRTMMLQRIIIHDDLLCSILEYNSFWSFCSTFETIITNFSKCPIHLVLERSSFFFFLQFRIFIGKTV